MTDLRPRVMRSVMAALSGTTALLCACATSSIPSHPVPGGLSACAGDVCAPEPDDAEAALVLFLYWGKEAGEIKPHIQDISNRSKLFEDLIQHYRSLFAEMEAVQSEGLDRLARGDRNGALARLNGLWMALPVATLQLNYVILASHAEDGGMVTTDWMAILGDMSRRTAPVLQAALGAGFDRHQMEVAAHQHRAEISELEQTFPKIQDALAKGGRWTRRGVYVADGVTLAMAAYDVLGLLEGGLGGGPEVPLRFPGLAGAGAAGARVVSIPVEVLESLRELIRLGALSTATVSIGLTLTTGKPEAVGRQSAPPVSPGQEVGDADAPDPRIDRADRLNHTWKHAEAWFGREVPKSTHLKIWRSLLKRAARSSHVFDWSSSGDRTVAHLARIEGKWFVVQFYADGPLAGELATAFVPNQAELGAMLQRLGH